MADRTNFWRGDPAKAAASAITFWAASLSPRSAEHADGLAQPIKPPQLRRLLASDRDPFLGVHPGLVITIGGPTWSAPKRPVKLAPGVPSKRRLLARRPAPRLRAAPSAGPIRPEAPRNRPWGSHGTVRRVVKKTLI